MDVVGLSAKRLAALVHAGDVTPVEILQDHLARIASVDPQVGAFQRVRAKTALEEAAALGSRAQLRALPLAGVPIAIKDNVPVGGEPMRNGSRATSDAPSPGDHPAVQRLRGAGAIVVGTTRVPELCAWADTDGAFGTARNPWDLRRSPGGSSGGSAAAVASAMVPLALGADGLGSIRIPAACCGLVGLKPGPAVVPANLGVSSWYGMAENGPLATTVEDAALMLSVLSARAEFNDPDEVPRPLRIAVSTRAPLAGVSVDRQFAAAALETAHVLASAGHTVEAADPPAAPLRSVVAILAHWFGGVAQEAESLPDAMLEPRTRTHVRMGRMAQRLGLINEKERERWRHLHTPFFERFDLLVTPALAKTPLSADSWSRRSWAANVYADTRFAPYAASWNFAGYPAAAIPAGVHSDGLPLSIQLVAPIGGERLILGIARQLERLRPWRRHVLT